MDELKAMKDIADALEAVSEKDVQKRILTWAWAKYMGSDTLGETAGSLGHRAPKIQNKRSTSSGNPKKQILTQIKTLNLTPEGKSSLNDFVAEKKPSNLLDKITVAVYYLKEVAHEPAVSIDHVYTCFKWMKWKLPNNFKNTIHQAGSKGFLDTREANSLQLTPLGENLIEHDLG